ncbi:hypothetical protein CPC08DRAFT_727234 [Agrocybe pediades]|nr:hypothetical protein CPC08DRAFT_727234 [Agrocybe pediades]
MSMSYSVAQQKAYLSANLNSGLILQFLFGIYTAVLIAALLIYVSRVSRTPSNDKIVIGTLAVLYAASGLNVMTSWYYTSTQLGSSIGATRAVQFKEIVSATVPTALHVAMDVSENILFVVADALLVWRCFYACGGRTHRTVLMVIALFIVQSVLIISSTVYTSIVNATPGFETLWREHIIYCLDTAKFFSAAVTSTVATTLICRQIYKCGAETSRFWRRYRTIIDALIQSSAIDMRNSFTVQLALPYLDSFGLVIPSTKWSSTGAGTDVDDCTLVYAIDK